MSGTSSSPPPPSPNLFIAASEAAYGDETAPYLDPLLDNNGDPVTKNITPDGFSAQAFIDSSGNVIVAFQGTTGDRYTLSADQQILAQETPEAYQDAEAFLTTVTGIVQARYPTDPPSIYVTGHSLGGAEAEYVASLSGHGGETIAGGAAFGAPGLIGYTNSSPLPNFTSYINYGDPVGSYASDVTTEAGFAPASEMAHVGQIVMLGNPSDADSLALVSAEYAAANAAVNAFPFLTLTGSAARLGLSVLGLTGNLANHRLGLYATNVAAIQNQSSPPEIDTGVSVSSPSDILAGLDAPLGGAGQQDFSQATFPDDYEADSPYFSVVESSDGSLIDVTQNVFIPDDLTSAADSPDLIGSDPGFLTISPPSSTLGTQSATFTDTLTGTQTNITYSASDGIEESATTYYTSNTSGVTQFDYTGASGAFEATDYYSGQDATGSLIGSDVPR